MREFINKVVLTDSELNAYCIDWWPDVYSQFTGQMDRMAKVNLLLTKIYGHAIVERLLEQFGSRASEFYQLLQYEDNDDELKRIDPELINKPARTNSLIVILENRISTVGDWQVITVVVKNEEKAPAIITALILEVKYWDQMKCEGLSSGIIADFQYNIILPKGEGFYKYTLTDSLRIAPGDAVTIRFRVLHGTASTFCDFVAGIIADGAPTWGTGTLSVSV